MFIKTCHLTLAAVFATSAIFANSKKKSSPNILIIMTDQQRWDALQHSGANDIIKTPNLDKLAAEGDYF